MREAEMKGVKLPSHMSGWRMEGAPNDSEHLPTLTRSRWTGQGSHSSPATSERIHLVSDDLTRIWNPRNEPRFCSVTTTWILRPGYRSHLSPATWMRI